MQEYQVAGGVVVGWGGAPRRMLHHGNGGVPAIGHRLKRQNPSSLLTRSEEERLKKTTEGDRDLKGRFGPERTC